LLGVDQGLGFTLLIAPDLEEVWPRLEVRAKKSALPISATTCANDAIITRPASRSNRGISRITRGLVTRASMIVSFKALPLPGSTVPSVRDA
jgi:hypothetical protein